MREVRFRGKSVASGRWEYGYYFYHGRTNQHAIKLTQGAVTDHEVAVIPETVGQFTGLKDKNGKEIFERDVVVAYCIDMNSSSFKFGAPMYQGPVLYDDGTARFVIRQGLDFELSRPALYEVIGNIYENPELITAGEGENA